jgi:hypothetical protein
MVLALGIWAATATVASAGGDPCADANPHGSSGPHCGSAGCGSHGLYPGGYGFPLKYHPGYGYGGRGLGVGTLGGYPYYGGPGYPQPDPPLNRCGRILPFVYQGGPGYPLSFEHVGPLVVRPPVAIVVPRPESFPVGPEESGYGPFAGALPYPESFFAPYTAAASATGSGAGTTRPFRGPVPSNPDVR